MVTTIETETYNEETTAPAAEPTTTPFPSCLNPIVNPDLPVTINLTQLSFGEGFLPNKSIEINGVVLAKPYLFGFYLFEDGVKYKTADMPLYFKPLFRRPPYVICTNWIRNRGFGSVEKYGNFPFKAGQPFILEFVAEPKNTIDIYINNEHFVTFSRVDLSKISQLYIEGKDTIRVNSLTLCPNQVRKPRTTTVKPTTPTKEPTTTPPHPCLNPIVLLNPKLPLEIDLVEVGFGKGFLPDKYIEINGRITNVRRAFDVHLMEGTYLRADEPFRFESHHQIRPQIVLDSWSKSRGSVGVKYLRSPLNIGQPIILKFVAAPKNTTTIYINNRWFTSYAAEVL
uniref:Galectin n=1 Tax=Meloidogyne incognita TaxID=6306 RepID=A0A914NQU5_MELIC